MASKPTLSDAEWASNANIASGPQAGSSTKNDPGLATRQAGAVPGRGIVGRTMNFLLNQLYLWCVYLNDLHNSSAFLSQAYAWLGAHTWDQTIEVDGEYAYASARSYTELLPQGAAISVGGNWALASNHRWITATASSSDVLVFSPKLPSNATVTEVRAGVARGAGGSGNIELRVYKVDVDTSAAPTSSQTNVGNNTAADTSGTSSQNTLLIVSAINEALSPTLKGLKIEITASSSGNSNSVYWVQVFYTVSANRPG